MYVELIKYVTNLTNFAYAYYTECLVNNVRPGIAIVSSNFTNKPGVFEHMFI